MKPSHHDQLLHSLAAFTCKLPTTLDAPATEAALAVVQDSLAVALGALRHPAAQAGRCYARHAQVKQGATLWGSGECVPAELAALVNAVPLRGYDYNDLYIGRSGGHPSDILPGVMALAEARGLRGSVMLSALAVGYEVTLELFDSFDLHGTGWDYPVATGLGAVCACARLIDLDEARTREALAIMAITHFVSDEVESGELNARGDLTMWKRFNAGQAVRQAIAACQLAEAGVEGAVRPFEGRTGFLSKLAMQPTDVQPLIARLQAPRALIRITEVTFKRWPVGSRAQSAIQSALQLHQQLKAEGIDPWSLAAVQIDSDQGVYQHLVGSRADPYHPHSRETADHALPYIVTAALLDGQVKVDAFDPARVCEPRRQAFLAERVKAQPSAELRQGAAGGFLSRVSVRTSDGREFVGEAKAPPGHRLQPFAATDFDHKLRENVEPLFGIARADEIIRCVRTLPQAPTLATLAALTKLADAAVIDGLPAA